jgi:putative membrane protein
MMVHKGFELLHAGRAIEPHDLLAAWSFEPVVVGLLLLSLVGFSLGLVSQTRSLGRGPDNWKARSVMFVAGWLVLVISLVSPLHSLGGALFSAHMIQHELLMTVAAPLLILSRPYPVFLWSLNPGNRNRMARVIHKLTARFGLFATPLVSWLIHALAIWVWHTPRLYNATLSNDWMHTAQHLSFMSTALLFWWCVFPMGRERNHGGGLLFLFTTAVHTGTLGALLTFSSEVWYAGYGVSSIAWGMTPLEDQQVGGMIMWIPGGIAYLVAALWIAARMLRISELRVLRTGAAILVVLVASACKAQHESNEKIFTSADATHGKTLIRKYGCPACHVIPGVRGANGLVGPPLAGIASRSYIAGVVPNSPEAMVVWLQHPRMIDPLTAMPDMGVTPGDAQDIAAYLYTLR